MLKKIVVVIIILMILTVLYFLFGEGEIKDKPISKLDETYNSNLLEDIKYIAKDVDGNEYIIKAEKGEIDINNSEVIYLEKVISSIKLNNSDEIIIYSDFGKYNSNNYDTIFSKNVVITYLDNKITGEYLDFSLDRNSMIINKNVNYINLENILKADVVEINIRTKDTKIYMYEQEKKVKIKSKN